MYGFEVDPFVVVCQGGRRLGTHKNHFDKFIRRNTLHPKKLLRPMSIGIYDLCVYTIFIVCYFMYLIIYLCTSQFYIEYHNFNSTIYVSFIKLFILTIGSHMLFSYVTNMTVVFLAVYFKWLYCTSAFRKMCITLRSLCRALFKSALSVAVICVNLVT